MVEISRGITCYWPILSAFVAFAASVSGARDPYSVTGFLLALLLGCSGCRKNISLTGLDLAIIGIWTYELILLGTSVNPRPGFLYFCSLTIAVSWYGVLRAGFTRSELLRSLLFWCSGFLSVLALIALVSFSLFEKRVAAGGFDDLYDFRFLHNSLGYLGNVWSSLLLGFLGVMALTAYLYRECRRRCALLLAMTLPVVLGVIRSFSRGVYAAFGFMLAIFVISLFVSRVQWKRKLVCMIAVGAVLAGMIMPYKNEVFRTLRMTETVSQRRSIDGRLGGAAVVWNIVREHPLTGVGSGNFSLAANERLYENDYTPFTSIALGSGFQLPVEKGLIGTLLWLAIPGVLVWSAIRTRRRGWDTVIVFTALAAIGLRELTFPVVPDYLAMQVLVLTLIAVYYNGLPRDSVPARTIPKRISQWLVWFPAAVFVGLLAVQLQRQTCRETNLRALKALAADDIATATACMQAAGDALPYRINRSALCWRLFLESGDRACLAEAERELRFAMGKNPVDIQLQYDLAVVLDAAGERDSSLGLMRRLVERFPDNALYRITLFDMARHVGASEACDIENLTRAIELAPGLLETPFWHELPHRDSALAARLRTTLKRRGEALCRALRQDADQNPIELAHYGKIMYTFGSEESSIFLLNAAVSQLPNLSRPWCYSGILALEQGDTTRGMQYLRRADMLAAGDTLAQRYLSEYTTTARKTGTSERSGTKLPYRFLYRNARIKFGAWYDASPLTFDYLDSFQSGMLNKTR